MLLTGLTCSPTSLNSGAATTCTVTLNQAAPSGGTTVTVSDNSTLLTTPSSATVASGATSATFSATAGTITTAQSANVTATLSTSSLSSAIALQPPATGLTAAYSFNAGSGTTAADSSGNGITGTINGATWTTSGKYGSALSFNGTSNYVDLGNPTSLQLTGSMTVGAWVYATSNPSNDAQIVAKSDSNTGWQLKTTPDTGVRTFGFAVSTNSKHIQRYSKTVPALNTWYYVTGVYNATALTLDIYVNGVLDNGTLSGTIPASQTNPSQNVRIGMRSGGYYFKGTIDEVRIYSTALTQPAIQANMTTPISITAIPPTVSSISHPVETTGGNLSTKAVQKNAASDGLTAEVVKPAALSCNPRTVSAGSSITCELRLNSNQIGDSLSLALSSSSEALRVPAAVTTRPNQATLRFLASAAPSATQQSATIQAAFGSHLVQETILVLPASAPVLQLPGKQLVRTGSPVSFQVSATDASGQPVSVQASHLPAEASFDAATGRFSWKPPAEQAGSYKVTFTAIDSLGTSSSGQVALEVGSGKPVVTSLVNGASQDAGLVCSPGSVASLLGRWLTATDFFWKDPSGASLQLGGTRVLVNGGTAPVLFASSTRVDFLCPNAAPGTALQVGLETEAGTAKPMSTTMLEAAPGIFTWDASGQGQAAMLFAGSNDLATVRNYRMAGEPAQAGDHLKLLVTGLPVGNATAKPMVRLGEAYAEVESAQPVSGLAGVWEIAVTAPNTLAGDALPVMVQLPQASGQLLGSNAASMAIEPVQE